MHQKFIHLRIKSEYSLLESLLKTKDLSKLAADHKMAALALTDLNNLSGALDFCDYATASNVQPIVGLEQEFAPHSSPDKRARILLLAQNETGYKNLLQINKEYYEQLMNGKFLPLNTILNKSNGLIAISGFAEGPLYMARNENYRTYIDQFMVAFPDRFYLELSRQGAINNKDIEDFHLQIAQQFKLPVVATSNAMYATPEDSKAHDALICIKDMTRVATQERRRYAPDFYFKSPDEMVQLFADIPEALENSVHIARRVHWKATGYPPRLPKYSDNEGPLLENLARYGFESKKQEGKIPDIDTYSTRLNYELSVITNMGFAGYFLIVADFISWSKKNDIPVGPGRGSIVGSIIAWFLGITDLDPMRFGLLFERFLNPDRISMPDIDVDFCPLGRGRVIKYIQEKYGTDSVATITTYGTLQARASLRDTGRVLSLPYLQVDAICKLVPFNPAHPITLREAIDLDKDLQKSAANDEQIDTLLKIALKIEGILRNKSTHAAGIVISDSPLSNIIPVSFDPDTKMLASQFHMKALEQSGLIKFDFLGLSTLTLIRNTTNLVYARTNTQIDISKIPIDDPRVYSELAKGETVGIFQLDTGIMKSGIKKIKPTLFEDLIALVSLNRPGPMENLPEYVARRHGHKPTDYLLPQLEGILRETHGIIVYQEQVMEIAKIMANYTLAQADILRRAMGKKIKEEMATQKNIFVQGARNNNIDSKKAESIFELVAKFAGYGFNKSHAAAYTLISYHTAWLKVHYPLEFMTALLNLEIQDTDKLGLLKAECDRLQIPVFPPSINKSGALFKIEAQGIRYALAALKNVGLSIAQNLEGLRGEREFSSLSDLLNRAGSKNLNKRALESLIKSGSLTDLQYNNATLFSAVEKMIQYMANSGQHSGQLGLFGSTSTIEIDLIQDWDTRKQIAEEYAAVGFYLMLNPVQIYADFLQILGIYSKAKLETLIESCSIRLAGTINSIHIRSSKRGKFANLVLTLDRGIEEVFIYDALLIQNKVGILKAGSVLLFNIKVNVDKVTRERRLQITDVQDLFELIDTTRTIFEVEITEDLDARALRLLIGESPPQNGPARFILSYCQGSYIAEIRLPRTYKYPANLGAFLKIKGVIDIKRLN